MKPSTKILYILWAVIVAIWSLSGIALYHQPDRGTFGDMFGAVNALFSGLAFATLIYTTWLQRDELALQRQELAETREELKGQKEELRGQNSTLALQRFENTFFAMLRTHAEIVNAMRATDGNSKIVESRSCFSEWYSALGQSHQRYAIYEPGKTEEALEAVYQNFYPQHQANLGHYFRHLYRIVKFVHDSSVENKSIYTGLIRSQLSAYEQVLLFYNCISSLGNKKFKPLVERYALLENMPQKLLISPELHLNMYASTAYGEDAPA